MAVGRSTRHVKQVPTKCKSKPAKASRSKSKRVPKSKTSSSKTKVNTGRKSADDVEILDYAAVDLAALTLTHKRPGRHDVMEVFSCPRLVPMAADAYGMKASLSLDLTHGWNALKASHKKLSFQLVNHVKPRFLMLSPPCTFFSPLMEMWNFKKMRKADVQRRKVTAHEMVDHGADLCLKQVSEERLFCFEHPAPAKSWSTTKLQTYVDTPATYQVTFDQCAVGLVSPLGTPIKKRTRFWTNSPGICKVFAEKQCTCTVEHRRIQGSEAGYKLSKWAQKYPAKMVKAILDGALQDMK